MKFDMPTCGGCRTCEMACSFKHRGAFVPSVSSIKILDKENEPGFIVLLAERADETTIACDGCKDFEVPFCIQFCKKGEDLEKILKEFWGMKISGEERAHGGGLHGRQ
jgi:carbon-monoxide dehydrogenase iron sulfur subunit